ncbi:K(+)-transporting ATPase subunit C [Cylindrospermopsis raciborskii]|uniref:K(+)-transporting ATPase subunit C n=1 Tax=Cylindrospermopsis raciborskii TaxID=77022 RepID=UPI000778C058|nr:K(+)-transporting ATPase subunit C [Cylindrospermopsis raciborskii]MCZ2200968.1 K(+)-transporting ATPase subunit C [Cylindrospermopsis raciborskii PAMP2012]MCZ2206892.1 K(+)-transporting ATPase subunit C [Cylindrospermopsis raciborskii PAMP2011]
MAFIKEVFRGIRVLVLIWILTAIIYPLGILNLGQWVFPFTANGSILFNIKAEPMGSFLIGQSFTSEQYFQSRPSAIRYSQGKKSGPYGISGGSNLSPTNPQLIDRISQEVTQLKEEDLKPIADLIYTSGSGLDPHISWKAARQQLPRVAKARGMKEDEIERLMYKYTDGKFLGIFGEAVVNVLRLNYALDLQSLNQGEQ